MDAVRNKDNFSENNSCSNERGIKSFIMRKSLQYKKPLEAIYIFICSLFSTNG